MEREHRGGARRPGRLGWRGRAGALGARRRRQVGGCGAGDRAGSARGAAASSVGLGSGVENGMVPPDAAVG